MYYVKVESGVKIAVYDVNPTARKTLFFIHGWPLDHTMFEYQLNVLPKLGFRCVLIDLRGFGNSDAPWAGYSYDRLADDVHMVIESLNVPKLTLIGFSMGGAVAIRYMARHKGARVGKLALLSAAAPSFVKRPDYPYGMMVEQVDDLILQLYKNRPQALTELGRMFFASPITPSFRSWFDYLGYSEPGYSTIHTAETLRDSDLRADLSKINILTGIFHGVLDRICPYEFAIEMNNAIKNSTLYRFDNSGHGIFYDELKKFNEELIAFLEP